MDGYCHSQVTNRLVHSHLIAHGVRLGKLPDVVRLGSIGWGGEHTRHLVCALHWGEHQLNGNHLERLICRQEEEDSRGVNFAVGLCVNPLNPWQESVMVVQCKQLLLSQSLTHAHHRRKSEYGEI
jgi:hypothetical protein